MTVTDWRAWTAQNGGSQPGQTSPFAFPGVGAITDLVNNVTSVPPYPGYVNPAAGYVTIKPTDPFGGWTDQKEFVANSAGAQVPVMRPIVPGLTTS